MLHKILKRLLDIVVAIVAIIFFGPLMLGVAIAIKIVSPGPIFNDINDRVGQYGKIFRMYKFRSMIVGAHKWDELLKVHPEWKPLHEKWLKIGKLPADEDPRIHKVGGFIRKTDLDEFSEFLNVLKGNMSVVGPRAMYADELERYKKMYPEILPYVDDVLSVKPGITGVWQIGGRNEMSIPDRFKLDADYARRKSVLEDIKVIIKTPFVMISRRGAYE